MPTITVAVFRGDPIDWAMYRHTALHVRYEDGEDTILHVTGAHPFFAYSPQNGTPEDTGLKVEGLIPVSSPLDKFTKTVIQSVCSQTPVRNDAFHQDWNCQNWVGEALARLVAIGCVTAQERSDALRLIRCWMFVWRRRMNSLGLEWVFPKISVEFVLLDRT